jgi:ABC-type nitrate/sulfonate/bicarbonate transport system permease component
VTAVTGASAARSFALPRVSRVRVVQLLGLAAFLALWEVLGSAQAYLWSTPTRVARDFVILFTERNGLTLVYNTVSVLIIGLVISVTAGVLIGTLVGRFRTIAVMFEPYFVAFYSVPRVAFVPLMVVWFGIGQEFVIAAVVAAVTIMIVFSTSAGVRETRRVYSEIATSLRITGWTFFAKVLVPGSIPYIATGIRLGVQRGLVAVIVGEFLIGLPGIGRMLRESRVEMFTDRMFSTAVVAMLVGVVLILLTSVIERRFSRWRPQVF